MKWKLFALGTWLALLLVASVVGIVALGNYIRTKTLLPGIVRDIVVAEVAHQKSGPKVTAEIDFNDSALYPSEDEFGAYTNSKWLAQQMRLIVPYMSYEGLVAEGNYPTLLAFSGPPDGRSLHILGMASQYTFLGPLILINERSLTPQWLDVRELFGTLTHEIIHLQGGAFYNGESESLESHTTAATIELLAAMCNYNQQYACGAFWFELENLARSSLKSDLCLARACFVYETLADTLWRDKTERIYNQKRLRYWSDKAGDYRSLVVKYGQGPYLDHVIPGILGIALNTGNPAPEGDGTLYMDYDDTRYQLGWLRWFIDLTTMVVRKVE